MRHEPEWRNQDPASSAAKQEESHPMRHLVPARSEDTCQMPQQGQRRAPLVMNRGGVRLPYCPSTAMAVYMTGHN